MPPVRQVLRPVGAFVLSTAATAWGLHLVTRLDGSICLLYVANVLSLALFAYDKWQSRRAGPRVPELSLLLVAGLMSGLGALLGMHLFRHKTRRPAFRWGVPALLVGQLWLLITWAPRT